jgi:hypothetical protein
MPWRKRGRTIPDSCADLDLEAAGRELIRASGNVSVAAKALKVPMRDLRLLTYAQPELIDAALEAEEQRIDEAQAVVFKALRGGDMRRRIRAAGFILRATAQGRRRGFG